MTDLGCFCFFKTIDLLQIVKDVKEIAKNGTEFFKLYTRKTLKDKIVSSKERVKSSKSAKRTPKYSDVDIDDLNLDLF